MTEEPLALLAESSPWILGLLMAALLTALTLEARRRATLGAACAELGVPRWRHALALRRARCVRAAPSIVMLAVLALVAQARSQDEFEALWPAFECLVVAAVVAWLTPAQSEIVVGEDGLQVGGESWSWSSLPAPTLEGQRLAFGPLEKRRRVTIPAPLLAAVRQRLAPDA